jgi:hypothetical protein
LRWSDRAITRTSRGKGRASELGIQVSELSYSARVRDVALDGESAQFLESCDGEKTLGEVFRVPALFEALPGSTEADKRRHYRDMISAMLAGDLIYLLGP